MSNSKSAIQEIKSLMVQFGFLKNEETEIVKEIFLDAKLVDGTEIKVSGDGLVEGAKVMVVTAEGEIVAPDGVHELEDGTKVETKEGIIAKIEEMLEEPEMEKPKAEVEIEVSKEEKMESEVVSLLKDLVVKLGEKIASLEGKVEGMSADFNAFKKEPAAKKIADGKTEKFNKTDDYMDSKLETIAALRKNNK
jgi:preprotein translocase subunit YajC